MSNEKSRLKEKEKPKDFDVTKLLKGEETFKVSFAKLRLTLKLLTPEDIQMAELAATEPGDDSREPKRNGDKYSKELLRKCVLAWESVDGGAIVSNGKPLECTPENIVALADNGLPGLAGFIFGNCKSAHKMYRTLEDQEIKN